MDLPTLAFPLSSDALTLAMAVAAAAAALIMLWAAR